VPPPAVFMLSAAFWCSNDWVGNRGPQTIARAVKAESPATASNYRTVSYRQKPLQSQQDASYGYTQIKLSRRNQGALTVMQANVKVRHRQRKSNK